MDGLDDFEKQLAAEKAEREREQEQELERAAKKDRKHHKHRHHRRREASPEQSRPVEGREKDRVRDSDRHRGQDRDREREREKDSRRHHRSRDHDSDDEGHRHKRSRRSREDEDESSRREKHRHRDHGRDRDRDESKDEEPEFLKATDPKEKLPLPDEEAPVRDSWMTAPSALDIDYVQRKREKTPPPKKEPERVLHAKELNRGIVDLDLDKTAGDHSDGEVDYIFGDQGSQWRMTKLKAVYTTAEQSGRSVDEVAEERFGSLKEFDDAREEKTEMERRQVYGQGYVGSEKPTGDLYRERLANTKPPPKELDNYEDEPEQGVTIQEAGPPLDQTALNRMRAQVMKAKLRKAPDTAKLEAEYNAALARFNGTTTTDQAVVLDAMHNRMLAGSNRGEVKAVENTRGRERGTVVANDDMTIDDMVREERRTRGQAGGEGMRLAERIAKDGKFDDDLEYLDDNAEKLAKRVHKSEVSLKHMAVSEYQKMNKVLESCPLCHHEDRKSPQDLPIAPIISLATRVFLTLPTEPELKGAEGGAIIVPISHKTNLLECDDDEWEEVRNFMKSLTRLYHEQGRDVIFYENAAAPQRRLHAALVAVPIPWDLGDTAPAFFREAMLSADEEWSQHKKIIDTSKRAREGMGKMAFRRSIAKEMPYFHAWFGIDGGLGHIVEDSSRWPKGDLFAREIIGGMLDAEPDNIKRQGRWSRSDPRTEEFKKRWKKFDWTRVLTEG